MILAGQTGLKDGAKVLRVDAQGKPIDPPATPATPAAPATPVAAKAETEAATKPEPAKEG